jgi:hypothetical protein
MKNIIKQYKGLKRITLPKKVLDDQSDQGLDRADDDGFAVAENKRVERLADQDLDCWGDLWRQIKAKGSRMFRHKKVWSEKVI